MSTDTIGVEEAGRALGVGRTLSYRLARQGQLTSGVPVIRVGKLLRVPTRALDRVLGGNQQEVDVK